jgi:alpha-L-rhamnosidase
VTAAQIAAELDEAAEVSHLKALADSVLQSFRRIFCDDTGSLLDGTQSALVLSLGFGLLQGRSAQAAFGSLIDSIDSIGHATTGIMSISHLMPVLASGGRADAAVMLLKRTDFPSWGFQLALGATTFWERWDAIDPSGVFQDSEMNSFNHYAFGSIGQWLVEGLAGIRPAADGPGYRRVTFAPEVLTDVRYSGATVQSPQGEVSCEWQTSGRDVRVVLRLPGASTGSLVLPKGTQTTGKQSNAQRPDVRRFQPATVVVEVGPGETTIEGTLPARRVAQDVD